MKAGMTKAAIPTWAGGIVYKKAKGILHAP